MTPASGATAARGTVIAFIGIGANLGEPQAQVRAAFAALATLPDTRLLASSSLYRSAPMPMGAAGQPDYFNAVARIDTALPPRELLDGLLNIESRHGRFRSFANAPRTLDLDLLLYGEQRIAEPGLNVPHPRMHLRRFVLDPLLEIAPGISIPGHGAAGRLAAALDQDVARIAPVS